MHFEERGEKAGKDFFFLFSFFFFFCFWFPPLQWKHPRGSGATKRHVAARSADRNVESTASSTELPLQPNDMTEQEASQPEHFSANARRVQLLALNPNTDR